MSTRYVPISGGKPPPDEKDGFLEFLGKLEWIRDAELENMVPFDTEKLRTPHIVYIATRGMGLALSLHGIGIFAFVSFFFLGFVLPSSLIEFLFLMTEMYLIGIKVGLPLWLIHRFVTFQRGLSTEMVKHYMIGYVFVSFFMDILSLGFGFVGLIVANSLYGTGFEIYDEFIYPALSRVLNVKVLLIIGMNTLSAIVPIVYFYFFRKRREEKFPMWVPLDTIPEDTQQQH